MAIRPVFAGRVPFLGRGSSVPPCLPICPQIFDSKFRTALLRTAFLRVTKLGYGMFLEECGQWLF